jgi:hypothetical protein
VSAHFSGVGHGANDLRVAVLDRVCDSSRNYRLIKDRAATHRGPVWREHEVQSEVSVDGGKPWPVSYDIITTVSDVMIDRE